jgi:hypothetical protein
MPRLLIVLVLAAMATVVSSPVLADNQEAADQVAKTLQNSGKLSNYNIEVQYHQGTARLTGHVQSQVQMNAALKLGRGFGVYAASHSGWPLAGEPPSACSRQTRGTPQRIGGIFAACAATGCPDADQPLADEPQAAGGRQTCGDPAAQSAADQRGCLAEKGRCRRGPPAKAAESGSAVRWATESSGPAGAQLVQSGSRQADRGNAAYRSGGHASRDDPAFCGPSHPDCLRSGGRRGARRPDAHGTGFRWPDSGLCGKRGWWSGPGSVRSTSSTELLVAVLCLLPELCSVDVSQAVLADGLAVHWPILPLSAGPSGLAQGDVGMGRRLVDA